MKVTARNKSEEGWIRRPYPLSVNPARLLENWEDTANIVDRIITTQH
jgi:hypothetical protein